MRSCIITKDSLAQGHYLCFYLFFFWCLVFFTILQWWEFSAFCSPSSLFSLPTSPSTTLLSSSHCNHGIFKARIVEYFYRTMQLLIFILAVLSSSNPLLYTQSHLCQMQKLEVTTIQTTLIRFHCLFFFPASVQSREQYEFLCYWVFLPQLSLQVSAYFSKAQHLRHNQCNGS